MNYLQLLNMSAEARHLGKAIDAAYEDESLSPAECDRVVCDLIDKHVEKAGSREGERNI